MKAYWDKVKKNGGREKSWNYCPNCGERVK